MAAPEHLSGLQFEYHDMTEAYGQTQRTHQLRAYGEKPDMQLGSMTWTSKEIGDINVGWQFRRRGVATAMWDEAHRLAGENAKIPQPKHSSDRTDAGHAWARSVGGRLPRRVR